MTGNDFELAIPQKSILNFIRKYYYSILHAGTDGLYGIKKLQAIGFNSMLLFGFGVCLLRLLYISIFADIINEPFGYLFFNLLPLLVCVTCIILMYKRYYKWVYFTGFIILPAVLLLMTFFVHDKALVAFQMCFFVYPFFFFNDIKKIAISFSVAVILAIIGYYNLNKFYSHQTHLHSKSIEYLPYITLIGAIGFSFFTIYSIKYQTWQNQKRIQLQKKELRILNETIYNQKNKIENDLKTRNKILSIISHDLRVPLVGLKLMLNSLHKERNHGLLEKLLPDVMQEVDKVSHVYQNLLYWGNIQMNNTPLEFKQIDISTVVAKSIFALERVAKEKQISINNSIKPETWVNTDGAIVDIIVRNIISNAIKFTPSNKSLFISASSNTHFISINIKDEGYGMSKEAIARVFENEFYTTAGTANETGTGLGLMICRELAEKCEGEIMINSTIGEGTEVCLFLPKN